MIFARRTQPSFKERVRGAIWPRGGWSRALRYFGKRILRLSGSPHVVATGFAVGVFVAWSPLFGIHYLMAIALAFIARGNVLAAILSTTIGNPVTGPAMWALDYKVGDLIVGNPHHLGPAGGVHGMTEKTIAKILPILEPLLVGWATLGLVSAVISYFVVSYAVRSFQAARRTRLEARRLTRTVAPAPADGQLLP